VPLPPGHAASIQLSRGLSLREKRLIGGFLVAMAALVAVLVISFSSAGHSSANGCIYLNVAAATGAEQISQCGTQARATCASARIPGAFTHEAAGAVSAQCRKAGLPVG
jgi:predicted acylesterase/phospholipase RssA